MTDKPQQSKRNKPDWAAYYADRWDNEVMQPFKSTHIKGKSCLVCGADTAHDNGLNASNSFGVCNECYDRQFDE